MHLPNNLKVLRKRSNRTQEDVAKAINVPRPTYSGYENNVSYPSLEILVRISNYYNLSIDVLLKMDFSKLSDSQIKMIEDGNDAFIKGSNIRVLASTVDKNNEENIEFVSVKAKAGYTRGFADPEFIKVLPTFQLPFLSRNKKYRTFQISGESMLPIPDGAYITGEFIQNWFSLKDGDACIILTLDDGIVFKCIENKKYRTFQISGESMLPIPDGAYITGEFIQNWFSLKDGDACIILTLDDGIVFKCIENKLKSHKKLGVYSLNPEFDPYSIDAADIKEIWKFVNYISPEMPSAISDDIKLHKDVANLKENMERIMKKLEIG